MNYNEIDYEWLLKEVQKVYNDRENIFLIVTEILADFDFSKEEINESIKILSSFDGKIKKMAESTGYIYAPYIPLMTNKQIEMIMERYSVKNTDQLLYSCVQI